MFWTTTDLKRLKWVCEQPGYFSQYLDQFPGRTYNSLRCMAKKMGWTKQYHPPGRPRRLQLRIVECLKSGPKSRNELAEALGSKPINVTDRLQDMRLNGKVSVAMDELRGVWVWALIDAQLDKHVPEQWQNPLDELRRAA